MRAESCTWRLISVTDDVSSSVADATDWTLAEASSALQRFANARDRSQTIGLPQHL
jgi:hypothetical protein